MGRGFRAALRGFGVLLVAAALLTVALVFQRADRDSEAATPPSTKTDVSATPLW